jgi:hypothetical protein
MASSGNLRKFGVLRSNVCGLATCKRPNCKAFGVELDDHLLRKFQSMSLLDAA